MNSRKTQHGASGLGAAPLPPSCAPLALHSSSRQPSRCRARGAFRCSYSRPPHVAHVRAAQLDVELARLDGAAWGSRPCRRIAFFLGRCLVLALASAAMLAHVALLLLPLLFLFLLLLLTAALLLCLLILARDHPARHAAGPQRQAVGRAVQARR